MNMHKPTTAFDRDYLAIADHGLIGNLHTAALVSIDGSVESYCIPHFDSPSVFARILDKNKGGHFSISPTVPFTTKQNYYPSSNVLQTKFMNEGGVVSITDFLPRQPALPPVTKKPLLPWLIRRVEVIRGAVPLLMECAPAFNYARSKHTTAIVASESPESTTKAIFQSDALTLDLRYVPESTTATIAAPVINLDLLDLSQKGHLGLGVQAEMTLEEGQCVTFVLRTPPAPNSAPSLDDPVLTKALFKLVPAIPLIFVLFSGTSKFVADRDQQVLERLDPPIVIRRILERICSQKCPCSQAPHFRTHRCHCGKSHFQSSRFVMTSWQIPSLSDSSTEFIGGTRNWDYRASWIRDSSFTLYALIRLGFTKEADAYMEFIFERLRNKNPDGSLQIMYTIHGGKDLEELELTHLDGHKGSKPVRQHRQWRRGSSSVGHLWRAVCVLHLSCCFCYRVDFSGWIVFTSDKRRAFLATLVLQLTSKQPQFGKPLSYDTWLLVRDLVDYVVANLHLPDLSIWEVRNKKRHFTYSKVMLWVAIDRGLRLADKRSLPCPHRNQWLAARDSLYEEIMNKAFDKELKIFGQSYEDTNVLDSAVLIMPLVFFIQPSDPRFVNTLRQILKTPERGGLTANNLVFRYDVSKSDDGVGGEEGTFCLCTLWCVEALTRAGEYDQPMLRRAVSMFEDFLLYLNHVGLCTEEISEAGEGLGNAVQGFTHVTLISAAYNLSRTMEKTHKF
ncbi:Glycoside hydrolase family 15 protein [Mycena sanguinolenta]|uniref:Glycoside hydrolase family 15 protein n=1 Tax=Mycena sanguinolenta TaxID=230812 RepID=A0A8H7DNZ5_9AGAR|nr:Glycoside hydrolase family 15 protein [Mycena sanguinolenta]